MTALTRFFPSEYAESVFHIDYEKLYRLGYRGLIFDIDNTLVHHGADSTPEVDQLFARLHEKGFKTLLLTNNDEERTERFNRNIGTLYICRAGKPGRGPYEKALAMLELPGERVVCIGDKIFRDVEGAGNSGLKSILVRFIRLKSEKILPRYRYAEWLILLAWRILKDTKALGDVTIGPGEKDAFEEAERLAALVRRAAEDAETKTGHSPGTL